MSKREVTFTYDNDPSVSDLEAVRFLIGDIFCERPLFDDAEVEDAIAREGPNLNIAAAYLAEHLASRFAREADITVGPVSKSFSSICEKYRQRADDLRNIACTNIRPAFPALDAVDECGNKREPNFLIGLADNQFARQLNEHFIRIGFHGW